MKDDQRQIKATIAVIVSRSLPKEINRMGEMEGVWVTDPTAFPDLAVMLRKQLDAVAVARATTEKNGGQKSSGVPVPYWGTISSNGFKQ